MRRKMNKREKDTIIHTEWKIEKKIEQFSQYLLSIAVILYYYSQQSFSKVFDEIWRSHFWDFLPFFNGYMF